MFTWNNCYFISVLFHVVRPALEELQIMFINYSLCLEEGKKRYRKDA